MSAIATVLIEMGYRVEGSDLKESSYVRRLRGMGAAVGLGHRAENLGEASFVVRSSAVRPDNPEILEAGSRGIPVISRAQMLSAIMATREGIAVAGTHGKTTTSSVITCMLIACGADPSYLVGGELNVIGGNAHYGSGDYLVAEADESDGSLLYLRPRIIVLTNVDWDHLDYFDSLEQTAEVFRRFLEVLPLDGTAVVCGDDARARQVGEDYASSGGRVLFYGRKHADCTFEVLSSSDRGNVMRITMGSETSEMSTRLSGMHNAYNCAAAFAVGRVAGMPAERMVEGISGCLGVRRRFETVGEEGGIAIVDDYAHHPTEVKAVMEMARLTGAARVVVVFQPHRYSRTRMLAGDFASALAEADSIVVADVYSAGEDPEPGITGKLIADGITERAPSKSVIYIESRAELARGVLEVIEPGDLVITMGAGDITRCGREILELLRKGEG